MSWKGLKKGVNELKGKGYERVMRGKLMKEKGGKVRYEIEGVVVRMDGEGEEGLNRRVWEE